MLKNSFQLIKQKFRIFSAEQHAFCFGNQEIKLEIKQFYLIRFLQNFQRVNACRNLQIRKSSSIIILFFKEEIVFDPHKSIKKAYFFTHFKCA